MSLHTLRHDKSGRWTRKTRWGWVVAGICTAFILGAYIHHVNAGGGVDPSGRLTIGKDSVLASQREETSAVPGNDNLGICNQVKEHTYECASQENLAKWQDYLEGQIQKLEAEKPVKKKATVTMYTSRASETDDSPCIAANGKDICKLLKEGVQTCASNDYKIGTKLHIENLGNCIVMDRMNRRYTGTGRVDFYAGMDLQRAWNHGAPTLAVTVIK